MYILLSSTKSIAQNAMIDMAGKPTPNFQLKVYGANGKVLGNKTSTDYLGKWLIIDFWSRSCMSCITAMPKLSQLQEHFSDHLAVLLVGRTGTKHDIGIESSYQRLRKSEKLQLSYSFGNDIFNDYKVYSTPHVVVVKPDGTIYAVTTSAELDTASISALIKGQEVYFTPLSGFLSVAKQKRNVYPSQLSYYEGSRKHQDIPSFTSSLTHWNNTVGMRLRLNLEPAIKTGSFYTSATSLERLFLLAYIGKAEWNVNDSLYLTTSRKISLTIDDPKLFNNRSSENSFTYKLIMDTSASTLSLMKYAMQRDLFERFGYKGKINIQQSVVHQLVVTDSLLALKLKSKAGSRLYTGNALGAGFQRVTMNELVAQLAYFQNGILIQDCTAISYAVDISLPVTLTNLQEMKKGLRAFGLDLIPKPHTLKILEIYKP